MVNQPVAEQWRDVVGYEGLYQVSSVGRIKSVARISPQNHKLRERIRKLVPDRDGYLRVNLCKDGIVAYFHVHRLVCEAFLEPSQGRDQVNHIDGNKSNNHVENLEWVTASENITHAFKTGLKHGISVQRYGECNSHCKLSDREVRDMRILFALGEWTQKELATVFRIGKTQVGRIVRNEQRAEGSVIYG